MTDCTQQSTSKLDLHSFALSLHRQTEEMTSERSLKYLIVKLLSGTGGNGCHCVNIKSHTDDGRIYDSIFNVHVEESATGRFRGEGLRQESGE